QNHSADRGGSVNATAVDININSFFLLSFFLCFLFICFFFASFYFLSSFFFHCFTFCLFLYSSSVCLRFFVTGAAPLRSALFHMHHCCLCFFGLSFALCVFLLVYLFVCLFVARLV